jgi:RHS repeat-associated protein
VITGFVYDNVGRLLSENTGSATRDYVWAGNTLVAVLDTPAQGGDTLHYVYTDGLGTPRAITTQDGTEVWDWPAVQNPFGERAASGNEYTFNLRFPGQYFDQETGLHYNYHRDYEPATGRYLESDPIGLKAGVSTYDYAMANPLASTDPTGLRACKGVWVEVSWERVYNIWCHCVWLCRSCHGSDVWSGNPHDISLPRTSGTLYFDAHKMGHEFDAESGNSCACPKPGPETGCKKCGSLQ